jgi:hypothetical protein
MTNEGIFNVVIRLAELTTEATILLALTESGTTVDEFDVSLADWYSLCTVDCWEGSNIEDPYWLDNSEIYY